VRGRHFWGGRRLSERFPGSLLPSGMRRSECVSQNTAGRGPGSLSRRVRSVVTAHPVSHRLPAGNTKESLHPCEATPAAASTPRRGILAPSSRMSPHFGIRQGAAGGRRVKAHLGGPVVPRRGLTSGAAIPQGEVMLARRGVARPASLGRSRGRARRRLRDSWKAGTWERIRNRCFLFLSDVRPSHRPRRMSAATLGPRSAQGARTEPSSRQRLEQHGLHGAYRHRGWRMLFRLTSGLRCPADAFSSPRAHRHLPLWRGSTHPTRLRVQRRAPPRSYLLLGPPRGHGGGPHRRPPTSRAPN